MTQISQLFDAERFWPPARRAYASERYWMLDKSNKKKSFKKFIFIQYPGTGIQHRLNPS
jgi:hypothetical protein